MKVVKYILALAILGGVVFLSGCKKDNGMNVTSYMFEKKTVPGIYQDTKAYYSLKNETDQLYFNSATNTFRIVSGTGDRYFEVVMDEPIGNVGKVIKLSVHNHGLDSSIPILEGVDFEIKKKEGNFCWLWNQSSAIGIIVFYVK